MEKAAVAGTRAGSRGKRRLGACAAVALCAACVGAWAQDADRAADVLVAQAPTAPQRGAPMRLQVDASELPRLDAQDAGFQGPRVDMTLYPSRPGRLGAVLGMSGFASRQGSGVPVQPFGPQGSRPSVDVGVRWSPKVPGQQIDVTAWRRMDTEQDAYTLIQQRQPLYGARVEMQLPAGHRGGFALEGGRLGLQLESGGRISIRRKNGGPMIYYRTSF